MEGRFIVLDTPKIVSILPKGTLKLQGIKRILNELQFALLWKLQSDFTENPSDPHHTTHTHTDDDDFAENLSLYPHHHIHHHDPSTTIPSSSHQSPKKYDVFVSFRGEDIRYSFISHLHSALCQNKIETFIDYRLEKGGEVWPALEEAINESTLFLVVFSENYASSTWCLNELTQILLLCSEDEQEQHRVIPVFYMIDPSHVRKQMGSYHSAFEKYERNNDTEQVHKWRAALTQAANFSGWHCTADRNEAELIGEIAKFVLKKLDLIPKIEYEGLVGIQERIADVESCLSIGLQDVLFIGIWGMGGIGKTTLATAIFNKWCHTYEGFCFLENVRQETKNYGITYLKDKLFSILLGDKEGYNGMPGGGSSYVLRRLGRRKVLVVLDDIDDLKQIENLAGAHSWFGPGSRVIITTRDKGVLGKKINKIYEVKALGFDESLQLFNLNAFQDNCLDQAFVHLSWKFVGYAKGLPLTLKVLGSFLCNKNEEEWNSQLKKLHKMSFATIYDALELSYDGLDSEEKNIFLDIACFFVGKLVKDIKMFLDSIGYSTTIGLRSLQDKALLTISEEKVFMHDLIQEMGWKIVGKESLEKPRKRSRLWDAEDIYQVLTDNNKGSKVIRGITLDMSKIGEMNLNCEVFSKMPKLKFLEIYDSTSIHKLKSFEIYDSTSIEFKLNLPHGLESLPSELRYLRWDNYPLWFLPSTFSAENLVKLEMHNGKTVTLWEGVQNVVNLKVIIISNSGYLLELPNLSKAINLEEVYISKCRDLHEIHPSILSLDKLKVLEIERCTSLERLESDVHLRSLHRLSLSGCLRLKEFSIASENMTSLDLNMTDIKDLSSSIGLMYKLKDFTLSSCGSLKNLPSNLFDGLRSLEKLLMDNCHSIFEIPHNICQLSSLSILSIEGTNVRTLPASIKYLPCLKSLCINGCKKLGYLTELPPSIQELKVCNCLSLKSVQFTSLKPKMACAQFVNCMKLDEHSLKTILVNVLVHRTKVVSKVQTYSDLECQVDFEVIIPGCAVLEWFKYRTTHASITMDFSSAPDSTDWGLIFFFVLGQTLESKSKEGSLISDHVFLYYDDNICSRINEKIKERRGSCSSEILLEMGHDCDIVEIKEWGLCPTYSLEYQNFIKQIALDLESDLQASASGMGVGCSYEMAIEDEEDEASIRKGLEDDGEPTLIELVQVCREMEALREKISKMNQQEQ